MMWIFSCIQFYVQCIVKINWWEDVEDNEYSKWGWGGEIIILFWEFFDFLWFMFRFGNDLIFSIFLTLIIINITICIPENPPHLLMFMLPWSLWATNWFLSLSLSICLSIYIYNIHINQTFVKGSVILWKEKESAWVFLMIMIMMIDWIRLLYTFI